MSVNRPDEGLEGWAEDVSLVSIRVTGLCFQLEGPGEKVDWVQAARAHISIICTIHTPKNESWGQHRISNEPQYRLEVSCVRSGIDVCRRLHGSKGGHMGAQTAFELHVEINVKSKRQVERLSLRGCL